MKVCSTLWYGPGKKLPGFEQFLDVIEEKIMKEGKIMKRQHTLPALAFGILVACAVRVGAQQAQGPLTAEHPYKAFAPWMETSLRFATDLSLPGGPTFQVKIYEWVIGPRREVPNFLLEGFATIEVKAGELQTAMDGVTIDRRAGDYWFVPERTKLAIKVKSETGRGDNLVILHGVVLVKK
jgi:hypothetical protein